MAEFKSAFVQQKMRWNKEELSTALHCLACCRQLHVMLAERGYWFDEKEVSAESWGASFEGCVAKYTLTMRRMLNLSNVVEIDYGMTVPDAFFLLDATHAEWVLLDNRLRLFLFKVGNQAIALYTLTAHSLADQVSYVALPCDPQKVTVKSKQGIRLWPQPEVYALPSAPCGYYEPPQELVRFADGRLYAPVSAGFVYRLAKAPAYIFAPPDMPYAEFRGTLMSAELVYT